MIFIDLGGLFPARQILSFPRRGGFDSYHLKSILKLIATSAIISKCGNSFLKRSLQSSVTGRKIGVITKYSEICIAGNPLNFILEPHLEGDTHQFTGEPFHNEATALNIAGESR